MTTEEIESSLPRTGSLVIYKTSGAGCGLPIFQKGQDGFLFCADSYGEAAPNYKDWEEYCGYGMCGSHGKTSNIHLIGRAIDALNKKQRVGLADDAVIEALRGAGYRIEIVERGFR